MLKFVMHHLPLISLLRTYKRCVPCTRPVIFILAARPAISTEGEIDMGVPLPNSGLLSMKYSNWVILPGVAGDVGYNGRLKLSKKARLVWLHLPATSLLR